MRNGSKIGIVTAAGYTEAEKYYERLFGLLDAIAKNDPKNDLERNLIVMGGESNFLFAYSPQSPCKLEPVPKESWQLPEMRSWTEENVKALLDVAEAALKDCVACMKLPVNVLRKERAVGIYPDKGVRLSREQLEETVLVVQRVLEMSDAGKRIPFCAFNGGNDVSSGSKNLSCSTNEPYRSSSILVTSRGVLWHANDTLVAFMAAGHCT
jgi:IMP and pyridine-specific 5'-nucleotidase